MNLEAERRLKFDRRLQRRQGWVTQEELQAELDSLPDSADKIYTPEGENVSEGPEESPEAKQTPPIRSTPETGGDF